MCIENPTNLDAAQGQTKVDGDAKVLDTRAPSVDPSGEGVADTAPEVSRRRFLASAGSVAATFGLGAGPSEAGQSASGRAPTEPLTIAEQGSFFVGGRRVSVPGTWNPNRPRGEGATYYIDHLYAQYQIPVNARRYPLVMTHGNGQTARCWETTPDGREGFNNIFLRRGFSVYLPDSPRRARAGFPSFNGPLGSLDGTQIMPNDTTRFGAQQAFVFFRLGAEYPDFYPNTGFPEAGLEQFFRAIIPSVTEDAEVVSDGFVSLLEKIGPSVLIAHSQSGPLAMLAAIKSPLVKAIYTYEPAGMVFPEGESRSPIVLGDGSVRRGDREVSAADFLALTKIPIHVVYGDNIPTEPDSLYLRDFRRAQALAARQFVEVVNRHGGDATFVSLPDEGLEGNTHFMFFDINHVQVADLLSKFLSDKGLDER